MNTTEALQRFEETVQVYLQELDGFSMEELKYRQAEDEWSIGQMYQHLIQSALSMHLRNIELCLNPIEDAAVFSAENGTRYGDIRTGQFPADPYSGSAVSSIYAEQPATKEQLMQGLDTVIQRMRQTELMLERHSCIPSPSEVWRIACTRVVLLIEMTIGIISGTAPIENRL